MMDLSGADKVVAQMLGDSGWIIQDYSAYDLSAGLGTAIRGHIPYRNLPGYILCIDPRTTLEAEVGMVADVGSAVVGEVLVEKPGDALMGVAEESNRFPGAGDPPRFSYMANGIGTLFADRKEPGYRSQPVPAFHTPKALAERLESYSRSK